MVIASCCKATKEPRTLGLEISARYMGTTWVRAPTESPATARPPNKYAELKSQQFRRVEKTLQLTWRHCASLKSATDEEYDNVAHDVPLSANLVTDGTVDERAEPCGQEQC